MALTKNPDNELRNAVIFTVLAVLAAVLAIVLIFSSDEFIVFQQVGRVIANLWWIILPVPMWLVFFMVHMEYTGLMWVIKQKHVLLEIKVPGDVEKSPKLMKMVFIGFHDYTTLSKFEIYCGWRPLQNKYSVEIASVDGTVHFYVRCMARIRNAVEAQIYAQYPDAEVFEVEDYTKQVPKYLPNAEWDVWGVTMKLVKADAYPIRSYMYFKEDITGKMIDPLASVVETMGNMGPGQHSWLQIIFTSASEPAWIPDAVKLLEKIMQAPEATKAILREIMNVSPEKAKFLEGTQAGLLNFIGNLFNGLIGGDIKGVEQAESKEFDINRLSIPQQEIVKAILQNVADIGYKTAMRYVYIARRENWDKPLGVGGLLGALKQTTDQTFNALRTDSDTKTYAQYYFIEPRLRYRQRKIVQNYRDRDYAGTGFYFTSEELATVFHIPDLSVKSPTVNRVQAKKGEAPANLPIEIE